MEYLKKYQKTRLSQASGFVQHFLSEINAFVQPTSDAVIQTAKPLGSTSRKSLAPFLLQLI